MIKAFFPRLVNKVYQVARDQAIIVSSTQYEDETITIELPPVSQKDRPGTVAAVAQLAGALGIAIADRLLTRQTAAAIYAHVASDLGVEVDAAGELEKIEEQQGDTIGLGEPIDLSANEITVIANLLQQYATGGLQREQTIALIVAAGVPPQLAEVITQDRPPASFTAPAAGDEPADRPVTMAANGNS